MSRGFMVIHDPQLINLIHLLRPACQAQFYAVDIGTHPASATQQGWSTWCAQSCALVMSFMACLLPSARLTAGLFGALPAPWVPLVVMKRSKLPLSPLLKLWNIFQRSKMWLGKDYICIFSITPQVVIGLIVCAVKNVDNSNTC